MCVCVCVCVCVYAVSIDDNVVCVLYRVPSTPDPSGLSVVMERNDFNHIRVRYH